MKDFKCSKSGKEKELHYELVKRYFRRIAVNKKGYYGIKIRGKLKHDKWQFKIWEICNSILKKILHENSKITKVIDVGCGIGDFTIDLAKRYPQLENIVGIDFIEEPLDIALKYRKQFDKVSFMKADLLNLPFDDRFFNITVCINTIHHVHIEDFEKAIQELARITDKYLILEIRNKNNILNFWYKYVSLPILYKNLPVTSCSISEVNDIIKNYNFKLQIARGISPLNRTCWRLLLLYKRISNDSNLC